MAKWKTRPPKVRRGDLPDPGLRRPEYAQEFLDLALATGEYRVVIRAIAEVVKAKYGVFEFTKMMKRTPKAFDYVFYAEDPVRLNTEAFLNMLNALGITIRVELDEKKWETNVGG